MSKKIRIILLLSCVCNALVLHAQGFRNIEFSTFVPKGQWIAGSSVSYSQSEQEDYNFLFIESVSGSEYSFKVSPVVAYAFADNLAAGGRFGYKRSLLKVDNINLGLGDDFNFDMNDLYSLSHSYSVVGILRNYISLGNSKRFSLFAETQLTFEGGQSKLVNGSGISALGTYTKDLNVGLGVVPGIVAFINNYTAVEVSIGILGVNYARSKHITNQIYEANESASSINFRINIFSIGLGLAFYL